MKSLTKDIKVIAAALETSSELVISGHRVRRKLPLPAVDEAEVLMQTVIAENFPEQATIGLCLPKATCMLQWLGNGKIEAWLQC